VRALIASGAAAGFLGAVDEAAAAGGTPSAAQDEQIFNFALLLEYLQDSFYAEALAHGRLRGDLRQYAEIVGGHEREHVRFLVNALGSRARKRPHYDFGDATRDPARFAPAAVALEDLAVAAYNAQAANLTRRGLGAAIKIVSVEGRHAAWIRSLAGEVPAPRAADPGEDVAQVTAALRRLHIR